MKKISVLIILLLGVIIPQTTSNLGSAEALKTVKIANNF
jgi:hypothetical protein